MRGTANPLTKGPFSLTIPDTAGPLAIPSDGSGSGLLDNLMDWVENIDVFMTAISQTNWDTIQVNTVTLYTGYKESSGAQNDSIEFDCSLAAGTWTFELVHIRLPANGIYTVYLDSTSIGTIDGYNASQVDVVRSQLTSVAVATTGVKRLKLKMETKNASATNYYGRINHIQFKRTA